MINITNIISYSQKEIESKTKLCFYPYFNEQNWFVKTMIPTIKLNIGDLLSFKSIFTSQSFRSNRFFFIDKNFFSFLASSKFSVWL